MRNDVKSKFWCFTLNNYTEEEESSLQTLATQENSPVAYLIYGREVGDSGTRHLQGYIEFSGRKRFDAVKRLIGPRVHLENRRGTADEAAEYCQKDGDCFEHGVRSISRQGRRTDLESLHEDLRSKRPLSSITDDHFGSFMKYRRSIVAYRSIHAEPRMWSSEVIVYWGPTGTGKTRRVFEEAENLWIYPGSGWFDGYDQHEDVLFDDFSGSEFKLPYLLKVLDRYPMKVPVKGDFVNWAPRRIFITSNIDPNSWFSNANPEHVAALFRRIAIIEKIE